MARHEGRPTSHGRDIGVVVSVNPSGRVTVRSPSERFAPEGTRVADRSGVIRGRVVRVFGPVARPYASVRLVRPLRPPEAAALVGSNLIEEER